MKTLKDMENEIATSAKEVNDNRQKLEDARDVGKALIDYCHGQEPSHRFTPTTILDLRAFAKFYAKRCGVQLDSECEHPYHSVVGGGGKPERCLRCGKILSD